MYAYKGDALINKETNTKFFSGSYKIDEDFFWSDKNADLEWYPEEMFSYTKMVLIEKVLETKKNEF